MGGTILVRIGIDLGGTFIKLGVVDDANRIVADASIPTRLSESPEQVAADMCEAALRLLSDSGLSRPQLRGVGIGSPGVIDVDTGTVLYSNNFGWEHVPLAGLIRQRMNVPTFIRNDGQCATLGEVVAGAGMGCRNLILLTLGTGVGGGVVLDGRLLTGGHTGGVVVGHNVIRQGGEPCNCGRRGCLEAYASATALIRETKRAIAAHPDSLLAHCAPDPVRGDTPFEAAKQGDPHAKRIVDEYIVNLGDGICNLVDIFRPDKVLISGGVCNQGPALIEPLNAYVGRHCYGGDWLFIPPVERALLGNRAGIIGAAALCDEG